MNFFSLDPTRIFETRSGVSTLKTAQKTLAVGNNQIVIAAVSGSKLRVMGWVLQSDGAVVGTVVFKSASGGTQLTAPVSVPASTGGTTDKLPIAYCGYFETNTSEGLYADITTAGVLINIFYLEYIP